MEELLFKEEVYAIYGATIEVHRELGPGFLEPVYQEALERELEMRGLPFVSQAELRIRYKGDFLKKTYNPDFLCYDKITVEIKALCRLSGTERAQVMNYLKASGLELGLLINFGSVGKLERERIIFQSAKDAKQGTT